MRTALPLDKFCRLRNATGEDSRGFYAVDSVTITELTAVQPRGPILLDSDGSSGEHPIPAFP